MKTKTVRFVNVVGTIFLLVCFLATSLAFPAKINAGTATSASVQISNPAASQSSTNYTTSFTTSSTTSIQCIQIKFATNADMSGGVPSGMTTTSFTLGSVTGGSVTGTWSAFNSTNGTLQFQDSAQTSTSTGSPIVAVGNTITNTSLGTFYAQVTTYSTVSSNVCSTVVDQSNVIALETHSGVSATLTIQPSITFSVANYGSAVNGSGDSTFVSTTATTVPFGTVSGGNTAQGSQILTVTTNAAHGYNMYISYTAQMAAGATTFRDQNGTPASPNNYDGSSTQSSLGYTADNANVSFGSNKWAGMSTTQQKFAAQTAAINGDATHIEFKIEPSTTQAAGSYSTTVIYDVAPSF